MNLPLKELSAALEKCILLLQSFLPCLLSVLTNKRSVWGKLGGKERELGLDTGGVWKVVTPCQRNQGT